MKKRSLVLNESKLSQVIQIMMAESNTSSLAQIARDLGTKETTFRSSITRDSIRLSDFLALSDILGYDVVVRDKNNSTD